MIKGIHHIAIICSDYERSKHFYSDVLGLMIIAEHFRADRNSWKLDLQVGENCYIELFSFPNAPIRPSYPEAQGLRHISFIVEDVEIIVKNLALKGIICEDIRMDVYTQQRFVFFSDPDGLPIELYEKK